MNFLLTPYALRGGGTEQRLQMTINSMKWQGNISSKGITPLWMCFSLSIQGKEKNKQLHKRSPYFRIHK